MRFQNRPLFDRSCHGNGNTGLHLCRQTDAEAAIGPQGVASVIGAALRGWDWKGNGDRNVLDVSPVLLGQSKCLNCVPERLTFPPCLLFVLMVPASDHALGSSAGGEKQIDPGPGL